MSTLQGLELEDIIGLPEGEEIEYKAVLPPSRSLAQMMAAFANKNGGFIILGVSERTGRIEIMGLSSDFYATDVVQKAVNLLSPQPSVSVEQLGRDGKRLFVIKVQKSSVSISLEGKIYIREGYRTILSNPPTSSFKSKGKDLIEAKSIILEGYKNGGSGSIAKFVDHYKSILNIIDELETILFPVAITQATTIAEGKILTRILFSSCADNFESYLADLLYEIYLANPSTLKGENQVTVKEVLNCSDMQEFIDYFARKKLSKLQRGSVKGFISDNQQIADLNVFDKTLQEETDRTLQIRHLYAHRNGIIDDKFLSFFPGQYILNDEHCLSVEDLVYKMMFFSETIEKIDKAAIAKYSLASTR